MTRYRGAIARLLGLSVLGLLSVAPWGCGDDPSRPGGQERCAMPVFDPPPGDFAGEIAVAIQTSTPGAEIRWTLDGSDPDDASPLYASPVPIDSTSTLKAKAMRDGYLPSEIATGQYRVLACSLAVLSPNGGETWTAATVHEIQWSSQACGATVRIELLAEGAPCRTISEETENDGAFDWVCAPCDFLRDGYGVRVTDLESDASDASDAAFAIEPIPPCAIRILTPNGGEELMEGEAAAIAWWSEGCGERVRLELLLEGSVCDRIADETENDGLFEWAVAGCGGAGGPYRIRVSDLGSEAGDESDSSFVIVPLESPCAIEVTSPAAGEIWQEGTEHEILWSGEGCGSSVRIELLLNGEACRTLFEAVENDGAQAWTVEACGDETDGHAIRVTDLETGESAAGGVFTIARVPPPPCELEISTPAPGAIWRAGEAAAIAWTALDCGSSVRIELLCNGVVCDTIAGSTANDGSYDWIAAPCCASVCGYSIRITDPSTGSSDTSDGDTCIFDCRLDVAAPSASDEWTEGSEREIAWSSSECGERVRIELRREGSLCALIAASAENTGSYLWTVAGCSGEEDGYTVRILDLDSGGSAESGIFRIPATDTCAIDIDAPAGGESWPAGTLHSIEWTSAACGEAVRIDLLLEGSICSEIAGAAPNTGAYEWTAAGCGDAVEGYRVRIVDPESGAADTSGASFSIPAAPPCDITVTFPAEGDSLHAGSAATIAWTASGTCGDRVSIELLCDSGVCSSIAEDTENDGSFEWTVSPCCDEGCLHAVRLRDPLSGGSATSGPFCICVPCAFDVVSPDGGESWVEGSEQTIAWTSGECGGMVRIDLLRDGEVCLAIAEEAPNTGSFSWIAENCGGAPDGYAIRVSGGCGEQGESDGVFSIPECALAITSPNGNETIPPGSLRTIAWTSTGPCGESLRIELLKDGIACAEIAGGTENDGAFDWTAEPCGDPGCGYTIRILDPATGRSDESDAGFCICADCPQLVVSPNGGEEWEEGSVQEIAWTANGTCDASVRIELLEDGLPCLTIADSTPNDGSFSWNAKRCAATSRYRVRVTGLTCGQSDVSDAEFSIPLPPCEIDLRSPAGGEIWEAGTPRTIAWTAEGDCGGSARIELLREGVLCKTISASTSNDGSYPWIAEPCEEFEEGYAVRVIDLASGASDETDPAFSIPICRMELTRPAGGESWQEGTIEQIQWTADVACGEHVRLELVREGEVCRTIIGYTPNDGVHPWLVQNCGTETGGYSIRITDATTGASDESEGAFEIPEPPCRIELLSPAGGETWMEASPHEIRWSAEGDCGSTVRIELVRDGGICSTIHPGTANDGSFLWTALACEPAGTGYSVRVTDVASGALDENPIPFTIETAQDLYAIESGRLACRGETDLRLAIRARNSQAIGAYGIRLCYDPLVFECLGLSLEGTRGEAHEHFDGACAGSCAAAGVIVSPDCSPALEPGDGPVLVLILRVRADAPLGPTPLSFEDLDPTYNTMAPCGGGTVDPLCVPGSIEICGGSGR